MSSPVAAPPPPKPVTSTQEAWAKKGVPKGPPSEKARAKANAIASKPIKKSKVCAIRLRAGLWDAVDAIAEHFETDRTAVVRRIFEDGIRRYGASVTGALDLAGLAPQRKANPFDPLATPAPEPEPSTGYVTAPGYQYAAPAPVIAGVLPQGARIWTPPDSSEGEPADE